MLALSRAAFISWKAKVDAADPIEYDVHRGAGLRRDLPVELRPKLSCERKVYRYRALDIIG